MATMELTKLFELCLLLFMLERISAKTVELPDGVPDRAFIPMTIYGRNITCDSDPPKGSFPYQTWTCKDMKVNGRRMAYGYSPYFKGKNHTCTETNGRDELGEVCQSMMRKIGSTKKLWVALVSNSTCDFTKKRRVMLKWTKGEKNEKNEQEWIYAWWDMGEGYGWIDTLQCMAAT